MKENIIDFYSHHNDKYWWFIGRKIAIRTVLRKIKIVGNILDFGCGTGGNLKMLSEFGEVIGVEKDLKLIEVAKKTGFNILEGSLPNNIPELNNKFSLIALLDVLEHIENDKEAINDLSNLIKKEGHIIITVPAFQFLWSKHDEDAMHFRRYTLPQLSQILTTSGFRVVYSSYLFFFLSPIIFYLKKFKKNKRIEKINPYLNNFLKFICYIEAFCINFTKFPIGSSLLVIAKKIR